MQQSSNAIGDCLDLMFDEFLSKTASPPDQWFHLSKLELDLRLTSEQLTDQQQLLETLRQQLPSLLDQQLSNSLAQAIQPGWDSETGSEWLLPNDQTFNEAQLLNKYQRSFESLLGYLLQGRLPWYQSEEDQSDCDWQSLLSDNDSLDSLLERLVDFDAWARLLAQLQLGQHPSAWLKTRAVAGHSAPTIELLRSLQRLTDKRELFSSQQGALIMTAVAVPDNLPGPRNSLTPLAVGIVEQIQQQLGMTPSQRQLLKAKLERYGLLSAPSDKRADNQPTSLDRSPKTSPKQSHHPPDQPGEANSFRIDLAGLILLSPYLPRLFERINWLDQDHQLQPQQVSTAAKALIYLASGEQSLPDHQLAWIKVLLGLDPEGLLQLDDHPLEPDLIDELELLLRSLLSHWRALKNTSTDGLRQAFLGRQGLLQPQDRHWQLTIERQGHDVLIDQLPFSIETVKLLWMPQPIRVSW
ncbi:hypothetical protein DV711_03600 [Motiliproteus coralliicola]|uniref:Uncharacterized protein n=1 Tax=Motiliproteus coralliicola TaxID=2283196 RepID=A0A369WSN6_9GAMM|nr:hypothetical protein DV711_03600 [Motiliproteus coralliicola]